MSDEMVADCMKDDGEVVHIPWTYIHKFDRRIVFCLKIKKITVVQWCS